MSVVSKELEKRIWRQERSHERTEKHSVLDIARSRWATLTMALMAGTFLWPTEAILMSEGFQGAERCKNRKGRVECKCHRTILCCFRTLIHTFSLLSSAYILPWNPLEKTFARLHQTAGLDTHGLHRARACVGSNPIGHRTVSKPDGSNCILQCDYQGPVDALVEALQASIITICCLYGHFDNRTLKTTSAVSPL